MIKRTLILTVPILAAALALPAVGAAGGKSPWIHIEVLEGGGEDAKVTVNLPLSLARVALDMAPEHILSAHHVQLEDTEFTVSDLRRLWKELRDAGDAEFVTVEDGDETIQVFRKRDRLFVHMSDDDGHETVRVEIPVALVDALLSGSGEELDLEAALEELQNMDGEIVRVEDGEDLVRVWIE